MSGTGTDNSSTRFVLATRWLKIGFVVLALGFGAMYVWTRWDSVQEAFARLSPAAVALSLLLAVAGLLAALQAWRAVLRDLGSPLATRPASRMFFVSQIGKYLPGSVWPVVAQAQIGRELHVPRRTSLATSVVALALSVTVGLALAAATLPFSAPEALARYWVGLLALPALLVLLQPRVLTVCLNTALRLVHRPGLPAAPSGRGIITAVTWQSASWVLLGLHVWVLAADLGAPPVRSLLISLGGFALAFCLGLLFIPAPAGAGIRDAVVVLTLGAVLDTPTALTVALTSRALLALCDFLLAAVSMALRGGPAAATQAPDAPSSART